MRIGILSLAHMHAFSYAARLKQLPDVDLVGVADTVAERGRSGAEQFGTAYYDNYDALLAQRLDGVIICAENSYHRELVELAAGRTPHILCEKPIAHTLQDGRVIIDTCAARGTKLQIAFPVRFSPAIIRLKDITYT